MPIYSVALETDLSDDTLRLYYENAMLNYPFDDRQALDSIFSIALAHRDRFPGINLNGSNNAQSYMNRWVKSYIDAVNNRPSLRRATAKSTCTDPAIRVIVQATQGLDDDDAAAGEKNHNLFMSAENVQGNLLEEYIASKVLDYGFLWCEGNVLKAVDFCNTDGSLLLQVKNKSNTENSSSSNIREGTQIKKWYRLGTKTRAGIKYPDFKWQNLNRLIGSNRTSGLALPAPNMSENDYEDFLRSAASTNPDLISSL